MERERNLNGVHFDMEQFPFVAADQTGHAAPGWWGPLFAELARQMNGIGSAVLQFAQVGHAFLDLSDLNLIQVARDFLAIARYERHRGAALDQLRGCHDLPRRQTQLTGDLRHVNR